MDYLVAEYRRLENNLMEATDESVINAIATRLQKVAIEIFNSSK